MNLGGIFSKGLSLLTGGLLDRGIDKVTGVPTPSAKSGGELGQSALDYFDTAFPGTTSWERLGSQAPAGQVETGLIQAKNQAEMQKKELANRTALQGQQLEVQREMNRFSTLGSLIQNLGQLSPMAARQGRDMLLETAGAMGNWDTHTQQQREILPYQKGLTEAEMRNAREHSRLAEQQVKSEDMRTKVLQAEGKEDIKYAPTRGFFSTLNQGMGSMMPLGALKWLTNTGSAPSRFSKGGDVYAENYMKPKGERRTYKLRNPYR